MRSHLAIPRENREYSPGERDLDVWLWLTGLSVWELWVCFKLSRRYAQRPVRACTPRKEHSPAQPSSLREHDIRAAQEFQGAWG
jgi:hypothetical protein